VQWRSRGSCKGGKLSDAATEIPLPQRSKAAGSVYPAREKLPTQLRTPAKQLERKIATRRQNRKRPLSDVRDGAIVSNPRAEAGASSMSEATVRLLEIEHEMNNLAQQLKQRDQPDKWDNKDIDTRMAQLVDEASKFKSRTIEQIILKARIADAYNFHDPNAELDTDLAESTVRDLIRLGPELTPV
jgi:hypothetical protein